MIAGILCGLLAMPGMTQETGAASGELLFKQNCAACHANGGNIINPKLPLKGSPVLKTFASFLSQVRKPQQPMPAFPPSTISDAQAKGLYDYILNQEKGGWK
jgi:cytochrome c6